MQIQGIFRHKKSDSIKHRKESFIVSKISQPRAVWADSNVALKFFELLEEVVIKKQLSFLLFVLLLKQILI